MYKENHTMLLLKIFGIYQIINPNSLKFNGTNIYKIINICLILLTTTTMLIGIFGIFYKVENSLHNSLIDMHEYFYILCNIVGNLKVTLIIYNSDKIWKLFDVSHHDMFLFSKLSPEQIYKTKKFKMRFEKISYLYIFQFFITSFSWALIPILLNNNLQNNDIRKMNITNLRYPIATKIYNRSYSLVYTIEMIMLCYTTYAVLLYDLLILLLLPIISSQYQIVSYAFENLKSRDDQEDGKLFIFYLFHKMTI